MRPNQNGRNVVKVENHIRNMFMIIPLRSLLDSDITEVRIIAMLVCTRERTTHVLSALDEADEGLSVRRVDEDTCFLGSEFSDKGNKNTRTSDLWTLHYNVEEPIDQQ